MWAAVIVLVVIGVGVWVLFGGQHKAVAPTVATFDPLNATYLVDGQPVALVGGKAQEPATPGSAEQVMTSVFGDPATGDLNGDGSADAAVIIVQNSGGSGTFYYVAAAIDTTKGAEGTNAILLGDRIAPQNISIQNGRILVNYADRKPGEPMSAPPSLGVSRYFIYQSSTLVEASATAQ